MKKITLIFLFVFSISLMYAQEKQTWRIGVEIGGGILEGDLPEKWNIRQYVGGYAYQVHSTDRLSQNDYFYFGIKPQISFFNERLSLALGVRFTIFSGNIDRESLPIYLRVPNPEAIEFYKVSSIQDKSGYLSVPLEMSYHIFKSHLFSPHNALSLYVKAGTELGLKMYDEQRVNFTLPAMSIHEQEILDYTGVKLNNLYATFYGAIGFRLATKNGIQYHAEFLIPSNILTKNNHNLIDTNSFGGFQLSVQFPIKMFVGNK